MLAEKRSDPFAIRPTFSLEGQEIHVGGEAKQWARTQFEATQAETGDLAKARRDPMEKVHRYLWELYLVGANAPGRTMPVMSDLVKEAEARLLEAESAVSNKAADRLAAYEKQWEWRYVAELIKRRQFRSGYESRSALERARYARLGAEIRLLEAQAKMNKK